MASIGGNGGGGVRGGVSGGDRDSDVATEGAGS